MAHLLSFLVLDAVGEVDGVVKEGGLRRRGGYDGDCVAIEEEDLHLGCAAARRAVSGRHHLVDVAGDGLENVHDREVHSGALARRVCWLKVLTSYSSNSPASWY